MAAEGPAGAEPRGGGIWASAAAVAAPLESPWQRPEAAGAPGRCGRRGPLDERGAESANWPWPGESRCWGRAAGGSRGAGTARGAARVSLGPARGTPPCIPGPPIPTVLTRNQRSASVSPNGKWGRGRRVDTPVHPSQPLRPRTFLCSSWTDWPCPDPWT